MNCLVAVAVLSATVLVGAGALAQSVADDCSDPNTQQGDACHQDNGDPGVCKQDPEVGTFTCEPTGGGGGCTFGAGAPASFVVVVGAVAALAALRRKRR